MKKLLQRTDAYLRERPRLRAGAFVLLILAMTAIQSLQLDLSCGTRIVTLLRRRIWFIPLNMGLVLLIDLVFLLPTRRWGRAFLLGNLFTAVWSVANHYAWLYSGEPITATALLSIGTALNVLGRYDLPFDLPAAAAIAAFAVSTVLALLLCALEKRSIPWRRIWAVVLAIAALVGGGCGAAVWLERTDTDVLWSSRVYLNSQGYPVYFLRQTLLTVNQIQTPPGYDDQAMAAVAADRAGTGTAARSQTAPDIILILNETFYDLDLYTDVEADAPYLDVWRSAENAIRGHAVIPGIGGGTNRAEYELLTGNSMHLLACQAPFNTMDMTQANSAVRYLKDLGYTAWAMHQASSSNYNRGRSYPALGFDQVRFANAFTADAYGNRDETDAANYRDLLGWYDQAGDGPRFMYLLTYQNHGGYEQNDAALDTVHTGRDFGELTDDVDEYLTSIQQSDQALGELMAALESSPRPALVCMVGDHSPSFLPQLRAREGASAEELEVISRSTPFIIWANAAFGPLPEQEDRTLTCTDLVPTVLDLAGLPLSPYYRELLSLRDAVPCRLSTGLYRTAEGRFGVFEPGDPLFEALTPYYYMEYNNITGGKGRYQTLFAPPGLSG